jgi:hypothetical protein
MSLAMSWDSGINILLSVPAIGRDGAFPALTERWR